MTSAIELQNDQIEDAYKVVETARATGKISKGSNEVTKALERGNAKVVILAKDTNPKEIILHLPLLSKEKGVLCVEVPKMEELGAAAGLPVKTSCIAVTKDGEAKKLIADLKKKLNVEESLE